MKYSLLSKTQSYPNINLYSFYCFIIVWIVCQVISEEHKAGPMIVLLKDVEKSFTGITESLSSLRNKLEALPSGVLIIGSHTQMDSRKEKVHILYLRDYANLFYEGLFMAMWHCIACLFFFFI